jgi:hypothetical protein
MPCTKIFLGLLAPILSACSCAWAQDPGWPRKLVKPGGTVLIYQPQVDDWQNFIDIKWRQAFQLTPTGGKEVVGAASFEGTTEVNTDTHTVFMFNIQVLNTYFPGQDPATSAQFDQLIRSFVPLTFNASLDRLIAYMPKPQSVNTVALKNDPPFIFVSYTPAILLGVDGEPVLSDISKTNLKYVVNTTWPLFLDKSKSQYYLLVNNIWMSAGDLHGPWARVSTLSKEFTKLPDSGRFAEVKKMAPPPQLANPIVPQVFYSTVPAEVILFDGQPTHTAIPGTQLVYANNTDCPVFVYSPTQTYLLPGRGPLVQCPKPSRAMDFRITEPAGRFCQHSSLQPGKRHTRLRTRYNSGKGHGLNRANSHDHGDQSNDGGGPGKGRLYWRPTVRSNRRYKPAVRNQYS